MANKTGHRGLRRDDFEKKRMWAGHAARSRDKWIKERMWYRRDRKRGEASPQQQWDRKSCNHLDQRRSSPHKVEKNEHDQVLFTIISPLGNTDMADLNIQQIQ